MLRLIALTFVLLGMATGAAAGEPPDHAYLADLIQQASNAKLADDRYWHLLLHYRNNLLGGYTSEEDDPGFFLSPDGKINPQEEMIATLTKFFSSELV